MAFWFMVVRPRDRCAFDLLHILSALWRHAIRKKNFNHAMDKVHFNFTSSLDNWMSHIRRVIISNHLRIQAHFCCLFKSRSGRFSISTRLLCDYHQDDDYYEYFPLVWRRWLWIGFHVTPHSALPAVDYNNYRCLNPEMSTRTLARIRIS